MKSNEHRTFLFYFLHFFCFVLFLHSCKTRTRNENSRTFSNKAAVERLMAYSSWPRYKDFLTEYGSSLKTSLKSYHEIGNDQVSEIKTLIVAIEKVFPDHRIYCVDAEISEVCTVLDVYYQEIYGMRKVSFLKTNKSLFRQMSPKTKLNYADELIKDANLAFDDTEESTTPPILLLDSDTWDENSVSKFLAQFICDNGDSKNPCRTIVSNLSIAKRDMVLSSKNLVELSFSYRISEFLANFSQSIFSNNSASRSLPEKILALNLQNILLASTKKWHGDFAFLPLSNNGKFQTGEQQNNVEKEKILRRTLDTITLLSSNSFQKALGSYAEQWQISNLASLFAERTDPQKEKLLEEKTWPRYAKYLEIYGTLPAKPYFNLKLEENLKKEIIDLILAVEKVFPNATNACVGRDAVLICDILDIFYTEYAKQNRVVYLGLSTPSLANLSSKEQTKVLKKFLVSSGFNVKNFANTKTSPFIFLDATTWKYDSQIKLLVKAAYEIAAEDGLKSLDLISKINAISIGIRSTAIHGKNFPITESFDSSSFFSYLKTSMSSTSEYPNNIPMSYLPSLVYGENTWHGTFSAFVTDSSGKTYAPIGALSNIANRTSLINRMILVANFIKSDEFKTTLAQKAKEWNLPSLLAVVQ